MSAGAKIGQSATTLQHGNYVAKSQILRVEQLAAVLAAVMIARADVLTCEQFHP